MASFLKKMRWFDLAIVTGGVFVVVYLQLVKREQDVTANVALALYGLETSVVALTDFNTTDEETVGHFEDWQTNREYYGAFASAPDGAYGWTTRYNTTDAAREGAMAFCGKWAEDCEVIAVSMPSDYEPKEGTTLSGGSTSYLERYNAERGAKAYAASEIGFSRFVSKRRSREEAERDAMINCREAVAEHREDKPLPDWPCRILRSEGWSGL